jgi:hypothetical protein
VISNWHQDHGTPFWKVPRLLPIMSYYIVVLSKVGYDYRDSLIFQSALSVAQWASLYQYQVSFGVWMVRFNTFPRPAFGTSAIRGCCNGTVEQVVSLSDISSFPTSRLKIWVKSKFLCKIPSLNIQTDIQKRSWSFDTGPLILPCENYKLHYRQRVRSTYSRAIRGISKCWSARVINSTENAA